ncbi:hypothetical protein ZONE111904_00645 [Zobellia nedashkovskayae]
MGETKLLDSIIQKLNLLFCKKIIDDNAENEVINLRFC